MPWATHSQLLTLAHVSARDEKESTMMTHPCWLDAAYVRMLYNTIAANSQYVQSGVFFHEFIYTAQATCVVLWQVYKAWNIPEEHWYVGTNGKPVAPMAFYNAAIKRTWHSDQRTVLQALATITAWHKQPFETSIMLENTVIPPVLLLFPQAFLRMLVPYARQNTGSISERILVFSDCQLLLSTRPNSTDAYLQQLFAQPMDYRDVDQTVFAPAFDQLVTAAGITSLFGTPTEQQWYNVHNSVLMLYNKLARPRDENEQQSGPTACCMKLVSETIDVMEQFEANAFTDTIIINTTQRQHFFQNILRTRILPILYSAARQHYFNVEGLGKYDAGQFVRLKNSAPKILRCMRVPSPVFF